MKYLSVLLIALLPAVIWGETQPQPVATRIVEPVVPMEYRGYGVEGEVVVQFVIDEKGRVRDIEVEKSTDPRFEEAVKNAVRNWRFEPVLKDGEPRAVKARLPVQFVG